MNILSCGSYRKEENMAKQVYMIWANEQMNHCNLYLLWFGSLGFRSCSCIWGGCHAAQGELRSRRQRSCWRGLQQFLDPTTSTDSLWTLRRCWGPSHWRPCSSSDAHPGGDGKPRWGWAAHHGKDGSWGDLSRSTGLSCMPHYQVAWTNRKKTFQHIIFK